MSYLEGNVTVMEVTSGDALQTYRLYRIVSGVVFALATLFICTGNALTIVAFCRRPSIRTRANYFIVQMAVTDLLLGIFMIQHLLNIIFPELLSNKTNCIITLCNSFLTCCASLSAIVAMNIDRFRSIMWPYSYDSELTLKHYVTGALQIWVPSLILGVVVPLAAKSNSPTIMCVYVHAIRREYYMYLLFPHLYLVLIAVLILNIPMFYMANKQITMISRQQQIVRSNEPNPEQNHFKKKLHLLKTVFIIYLTFYGCWLPYTVAISFEAYDDHIYSTLNHPVYFIARFFAYPVIMNSGLNPIIYAVRLPVFRQEFVNLLKHFLPKNSVHPDNSSAA